MGFHPVEIGHGWVVLRCSGKKVWLPLTHTFARTRAEAIALAVDVMADRTWYARGRRAGLVRVVRCVLQPCFNPLEKERR